MLKTLLTNRLEYSIHCARLQVYTPCFIYYMKQFWFLDTLVQENYVSCLHLQSKNENGSIFHLMEFSSIQNINTAPKWQFQYQRWLHSKLLRFKGEKRRHSSQEGKVSISIRKKTRWLWQASQLCLGPGPLVGRPAEIYRYKQGNTISINVSGGKMKVLHAINCKDSS